MPKKLFLNLRELKILLEMVRAFDKVAKKNNISYFLWGGTLLGAYRNGSILVRPAVVCCRSIFSFFYPNPVLGRRL